MYCIHSILHIACKNNIFLFTSKKFCTFFVLVCEIYRKIEYNMWHIFVFRSVFYDMKESKFAQIGK